MNPGFFRVLNSTVLVLLLVFSGRWVLASARPATSRAAGDGTIIVAASYLTPLTDSNQIFLPIVQKAGVTPVISCFIATPPSITAGGSSVLNWCISDALTTTLNSGIGAVTGVSVTVSPVTTTLYTLTALNPFGVVSRTLTLTVTGATPCGNIAAVQAWDGTLGFSYSKSASNADESLSMQRGGNVSFHIEQSGSGPGGVSWIGFATGNVNINDRHVDFTPPPPPKVSTLIGSGAPITLVQGIEEHSRITLNVRYSDCAYNFSFDPFVEATHTDSGGSFVGEFSVGSLRGSNRPLNSGTLSGNMFFPAHTTIWGQQNDGDAYFPGIPITGGLFPDENSLGSASVQWSFTRAS